MHNWLGSHLSTHRKKPVKLGRPNKPRRVEGQNAVNAAPAAASAAAAAVGVDDVLGQ